MTATIIRNRRDVATLDPKILLLDITNEDGTIFRNHCWVSEAELKDFVPRRNTDRVIISFEADVKTYYSGKETLHNIKNTKILKD